MRSDPLFATRRPRDAESQRRPGHWPRWASRVGRGIALVLSLGPFACSGDGTGPEPLPTGQLIRGQATALDGSDVTGVPVVLRWGAQEARTELTPSGAFIVRLAETSPAEFGVLTLEPGSATPVHAAWLTVDNEDVGTELSLVLLPTDWRIEDGVYAGQVVAVDPAGAADARVLPSYWGALFPFQQDGFEQAVVDSTRWVAQFTTWPGASFPIPVALDRPGSTTDFSPADSTALWSSIDRLEAVLGRDLFEPAALDDMVVDTAFGNRFSTDAVLVRVDSTQAFRGRGGSVPEVSVWFRSEDVSAWSGSAVERMSAFSGDLRKGGISVREKGLFEDPRIVPHELMHVLGVGHGCTWSSVQTYCASKALDLPSAPDVAHLEVLAAARELEKALSTQHGLLAAIFGHRVVTLGLSPIPDADVLFGPDNDIVAPLDLVARPGVWEP